MGKETTASGNIRFTAERNANGHADRFWAVALALHAGKAPSVSGQFARITRPGRFARGIESRRNRALTA